MNNGKRKGLVAWSKTYAGKKFLTSVAFLFIPIVLLITFTFIPAFDLFRYSFFDADNVELNEFVGLDNYKTVFTDDGYLTTFKNSLYYLGGSFIQQILALLVAAILSSKVFAKGVFKGIIFFPYLMNSVAVGLIFKFFFQSAEPGMRPHGALNTVVTAIGMDPHLWLEGAVSANICLVFVSLWKYIGFDIIMYLGAIQSISPDLYEAARLDGANPWQTFKYIIFPSIKPIISLQLILSVKGALSVFEVPFIISRSDPDTMTFVMKTMDLLDQNYVGLASAMGVVLLIFTVIVTAIQKAFFGEEEKPKKEKKSKGGIL